MKTKSEEKSVAKVTVLGAGGWGMALAIAAYNNGCEVSVWSPFKEEVELLSEHGYSVSSSLR